MNCKETSCACTDLRQHEFMHDHSGSVGKELDWGWKGCSFETLRSGGIKSLAACVVSLSKNKASK